MEMMEVLELPGWRIEYDRGATAAAHAGAAATRPALCGCDPCRNWAATRLRLLPEEFLRLLDRLGIPFDREVEVYHNCRLESGLHSYGAWYHFIGRVLSGGARWCAERRVRRLFALFSFATRVIVRSVRWEVGGAIGDCG